MLAGPAPQSPADDVNMSQACETCGSSDNAADMLLCDGCNKGYHLKCLRPKMEAIPDGDWYCGECRPQPAVSVKPKTIKLELSDDSDTDDTEEFQAVPHKPTARQATLQGECRCSHGCAITKAAACT